MASDLETDIQYMSWVEFLRSPTRCGDLSEQELIHAMKALTFATVDAASLSELCSDATAMANLAKHQQAIRAFINNDTSLAALAASDTAMDAFKASDIAFAELANSSKALENPTILSFVNENVNKIASSDTPKKYANYIAANPDKLIGKKRSVAISGYNTHTFSIAAVNAESAGTFTFICDDCIGTHQMNSSNTASGGWGSCAMRSWLSDTLFPAFPTELKNVIKSVSKKNTAGYGDATTNDKLWLPSRTEMGFVAGNSEGAAYPLFTSSASRIRKNGSNNQWWWLRSVYSSDSFYTVGTDGALYGNGASYSCGVVPGFTI